MKHKRFMQNPRTENRIISGALYFLAVCAIVILITSCSPLAAYETPAAPTPTATVFQIREWWMYSTVTPSPRPIDGRANYQ